MPAAEIRSGGADRPLSTRCNYPAGVHAGFVLLTDVDAQLEQFTVNARRSPSRVLDAHLAGSGRELPTVPGILYSPRSSSHKAVSLISTTW